MDSFDESKKRKVTSVVSNADRAELERHHKFLPEPLSESSSTWQERMVHRYHEHLYKDFVLADLTRASRGQVGLRWRTHAEVQAGKGSESCGNKHCPSHQRDDCVDPRIERDLVRGYLDQDDLVRSESDETTRLHKLPYGILLANFEVPFSYQEDSVKKMELVKLRLCVRCAPLLFLSNGEVDRPALAARRVRVVEATGGLTGRKATGTTGEGTQEAQEQSSRSESHDHKKRKKVKSKRRKATHTP